MALEDALPEAPAAERGAKRSSHATRALALAGTMIIFAIAAAFFSSGEARVRRRSVRARVSPVSPLPLPRLIGLGRCGRRWCCRRTARALSISNVLMLEVAFTFEQSTKPRETLSWARREESIPSFPQMENRSDSSPVEN